MPSLFVLAAIAVYVNGVGLTSCHRPALVTGWSLLLVIASMTTPGQRNNFSHRHIVHGFIMYVPIASVFLLTMPPTKHAKSGVDVLGCKSEPVARSDPSLYNDAAQAIALLYESGSAASNHVGVFIVAGQLIFLYNNNSPFVMLRNPPRSPLELVQIGKAWCGCLVAAPVPRRVQQSPMPRLDMGSVVSRFPCLQMSIYVNASAYYWHGNAKTTLPKLSIARVVLSCCALTMHFATRCGSQQGYQHH